MYRSLKKVGINWIFEGALDVTGYFWLSTLILGGELSVYIKNLILDATFEEISQMSTLGKGVGIRGFELETGFKFNLSVLRACYVCGRNS